MGWHPEGSGEVAPAHQGLVVPWWALGLGASLLVAGASLWAGWSWLRVQPEFSLWRLQRAVHDQDRRSFHKLVDMTAVGKCFAAGAWQALEAHVAAKAEQQLAATDNPWARAGAQMGHGLGLMMMGAMKPKFDEQLQKGFKDSIEAQLFRWRDPAATGTPPTYTLTKLVRDDERASAALQRVDDGFRLTLGLNQDEEGEWRVVALDVLEWLSQVEGAEAFGLQASAPPNVPPAPAASASVGPFPSVHARTIHSLEWGDGAKQEVVVEGPDGGPAVEAGSRVLVHYEGYLVDAFKRGGGPFDSSLARREALAFTQGDGTMIPGFDRAVLGMRLGETRRIWVPAALAYGPAGASPHIPPHADLLFMVQLLSTTPGQPSWE